MLNHNQIDTIDNLVQQKTLGGEMFTAWDITRTLRSQNEWVKHDDVKARVHELFHNGTMGYDRTLAQLGSVFATAFVYHPFGTDASQYVGAGGVQASGFAPQTPTSDADDDSSADPAPVKTAKISPRSAGVTLDKFGRLRVPSNIIRQLGLGPGDKAFVEVDGDTVRVSASGQGRTYVVDCYCNIRVSLKKTPRAPLTINVQNGIVEFITRATSGLGNAAFAN